MIIHDCEQGSEDWHKLRAGIPTASEFSNLVTSTGDPSKSMAEYAIVLAGNAYAGKSLDAWSGNQYTERGTDLEAEARAAYEFRTDQEVSEVGFVTDDLQRWGASPDGLVGDEGVVEFKCQIAKEHIKTFLYYEKNGKCPTTYVQQTQGEMLICERKWVDLVFYHPDLPLLIIRQKPIKAVVEGLNSQLEAVTAERDRILALLQDGP